MTFPPSASWSWLLLAGLCTPIVGCRPTVDFLGYNRPDVLLPLNCPAPYRSAYRDVLGKTDQAIGNKLTAAYQQLFHGTPADQAIYFVVGSDQAIITDVLHNNEVRTEGMSLAMVVSAMLNRQDEFDRLWRYSKSQLINKTGALTGYFQSHCDIVQIPPAGTASASRPCADPYGLEQFVTALLLARQRWGTLDGDVDYTADVVQLFALMRGTDASGTAGASGTESASPPTFDSASKLPFDEPGPSPARITGTALIMPGYYTLWAQVTRDSLFSDAAVAGRQFLKTVANPTTGLLPVRASFNAVPVDGWGNFSAEAYRALLNLVVDRLWATSDPWQGPQIEALVKFFWEKNIDTYGAAYTLDGTVALNTDHSIELVMTNAVVASLSNNAQQKKFLEAAWAQSVPSGPFRYYPGLIYLVSSLILGGRYQVCP